MPNVHKGDNVTWNSSGGQSAGKVTKKITEDTKIGGHTVRAGRNDPQFEVQSDSSGKKAIHKPDSLDKK